MAASPYIVDPVTEANFGEAVIERSREVPVLVDFWAEWCGPCRMLMPVLSRLAEEYGGRFVLAKVNTDSEQGLAMRYGIRGIPALKLFRNGEVVEELVGVQPESTIRAMIDRYIERPADRVREEARAAVRAGAPETAVALLRRALEEEPDYAPLRLDLAAALAAAGRFDEAEETFAALPREVRESAEGKALAARLLFARAATEAPPRERLEEALREGRAGSDELYALAARRVVAGEHEGALELLLELLRRDPGYRDGAARRAVLAVFDLLGGEGELVQRYRKRLFALLH
ncbi:MAG TPA: thioredoxin [Chromatiales bacterium]|nr:thioredoxin [Chromatiales bacterium]